MTTLTNCRKWMKQAGEAKATQFVIVHTPGHVDQTKVATDRGFTVLPIAEVYSFQAEIDGYYDASGGQMNFALADGSFKAYGSR